MIRSASRKLRKRLATSRSCRYSFWNRWGGSTFQAMVSVMAVNNEIGVAQDTGAVGRLCRERGVLFHVDAAQATGKIQIDLARLKVDLMSFSAHKTYGPKGVGALFVLVVNGVGIGTVFGHLQQIGYGDPLWRFVCGHAPFELTAIVLAGGAGLRAGAGRSNTAR